MSLYKGDKLLKVDPSTGKPFENEVHTEWEIVELTPSFRVEAKEGEAEQGVGQVVLLRKIH